MRRSILTVTSSHRIFILYFLYIKKKRKRPQKRDLLRVKESQNWTIGENRDRYLTSTCFS